MNVHRCDKSVATDNIHYDTSVIDDCPTCAHLCVGIKSPFSDVYGMKIDKQFVNILDVTIYAQVAMSKFIIDHAKPEFINRAQSILISLFIGYRKSEPHFRHKNFSGCLYQKVKLLSDAIIDHIGSYAYTWLLDLIYTHDYGISGILITKYTGSTADIVPSLRFYFWKPVYYKVDESDFPSHSTEHFGHWVGIAEHVGHYITFKVFTDDTQNIIFHSNV